VASGSVPVSLLDDLGVEGNLIERNEVKGKSATTSREVERKRKKATNLDSPLLSTSDEKESSHPEVISH